VPSPFRGMNPYLEQETVWQDFHSTFIPTLRELLNQRVAPKYFVKVEEYVFVHELPADERRRAGRAAVVVGPAWEPEPSAGQVQTAPAPAYALIPTVAIDREPHAYLSLRDRANQSIVTVIELLSPSNNNPRADREDYIRKRREFFLSGVHVVEIDLQRGGPRLPLEPVPTCDYLLAVSRAQERPRVAIWPLGLRDRLPSIPIPLRAPDPDAMVDLQEALNRVYDAAGYANFIYSGQPQPPLPPNDAAWATQFLRD